MVSPQSTPRAHSLARSSEPHYAGWPSTAVRTSHPSPSPFISARIPGIRLAEKRSLPCPRRNEWYNARDALYEEIMQKAWNPEKRFFAQSYEDKDILDSALLIMPLVFFSTPVRHRRSCVRRREGG